MGKIIAISLYKGGVGKTSTAQALAVGLFNRGKKVLLVDLDVQANLTYSMGVNAGSVVYSADMLLQQSRRIKTKSAIIKTNSCDIIASGAGLAQAESALKDHRETRLKMCLDEVRREYDFIIIDTPMQNGILTVNALAAADSVLIPVKADVYSLQGIGQEIGVIRDVKRAYNPGLQVSGIVVNCYRQRTLFNQQVLDQLKATAGNIGVYVYNSMVRESIVIPEAQAKRTDIYSYSPKSSAAVDYNKLVDELLEREAM